MHRAIPVGNRLLSRIWEERSEELHRRKLRDMRARVDSASPHVFPHTARRAKKEQLLEEHYTEIERENRLLLEKMSSIMKGKQEPKPQPARKRSLNQDFRRRELVKITQENQALLRRLQGRTSAYSTYRWEVDRKKTERLLKNICEFPYQLGVTAYDGRRRYGSMETRAVPRQEAGEAGGRKEGSFRPAGTTERHRRLAPLDHDPSKELLFKRGVNINDKYFLVEITKIPGSVEITAFDIETPDSYKLQLGDKEALQMMQGDRNYDRLVELLVFQKGELMLMEEKQPGRPHGRYRKERNSLTPRGKTGKMKGGVETESDSPPLRVSDLTEKDTVLPYLEAIRTPEEAATPVDLAAGISSKPLLSDSSQTPES